MQKHRRIRNERIIRPSAQCAELRDWGGAVLKLLGTCLDGIKAQGQLAAALDCESEGAIDETIMALEDAHDHIYSIKTVADDLLDEMWSEEARQAAEDERLAYLGNQLWVRR